MMDLVIGGGTTMVLLRFPELGAVPGGGMIGLVLGVWTIGVVPGVVTTVPGVCTVDVEPGGLTIGVVVAV